MAEIEQEINNEKKKDRQLEKEVKSSDKRWVVLVLIISFLVSIFFYWSFGWGSTKIYEF